MKQFIENVHRAAKSLTLTDVRNIAGLMASLEHNIANVPIGSAKVVVNNAAGEPLAEVWWNPTREEWLADLCA